jgi:hypothetical protein
MASSILSAGQTSANDLNRPSTPFAVEPINAFYVFLAANTLAALFAPIQDCDETFNYWEPTHFISHGYGLETWEYSPDYAIRSWLYVALHAIFGNLRRLLPFSSKAFVLDQLHVCTSADTKLGWGILLHPICASFHLRSLPDSDVSGCQQYFKSPDRTFFHDVHDI